MGDFFNNLSVFEKILFVISASATIILVIQTILALFGMDNDSELSGVTETESAGGGAPDDTSGADADNDAFDAQGLRLFTVRGVVAFLMVGSWVGFIASRAGISEFISVVFAVVSGTLSLIGIAKLMQVLMSLHEDGTLKLNNAIGQTGTVYIRIPGYEKGAGKVNVTVQETLCEFDAVTESAETLKTGELIYVTDVRAGNVLVVERVDKA